MIVKSRIRIYTIYMYIYSYSIFISSSVAQATTGCELRFVDGMSSTKNRTNV